MKHIIGVATLLVLLTTTAVWGQKQRRENSDKPKIVIGLMVDQMRWDYMYKYRARYGEGGFNRLLNEGFSCDNTFIQHVPTATAVGHSAVWTGSIPAVNGIVENSWYDRDWRRKISNVEDSVVKMIGTDSPGKSPNNLLVTTVGDELRMATNFQSKVVGIAFKDRAAILPAGHTANAAFWWSHDQFTTSTYYMEELPDWLKQFNAKNWKEELMPDGWNTLYPIDSYTLSDPDNSDYEKTISGEKEPIFPHKKASLRSSPFGNTLTFELAKAAIEGYQLGSGEVTDLLAISLSSPDAIGHRFAATSVEVEDNYLRLDQDLEALFDYLDRRFGKDGYLFFLTADHGASQSGGFLKKHRIPTGVISEESAMEDMTEALVKEYGTTEVIKMISGAQVYLDYNKIEELNLNRHEVAWFVAEQLKRQPGIRDAFPGTDINLVTLPSIIRERYANSYYFRRSGDIQLVKAAGWAQGSLKGGDHGDWNPYDSHIPLVWLGKGIKPGHIHRTTSMYDIAPTISAILDIQMPSGSVGEVITEITDE